LKANFHNVVNWRINRDHPRILVKNSTKPVRFCWPLTFGPIDRCAAILPSCSFHFKLNAT